MMDVGHPVRDEMAVDANVIRSQRFRLADMTSFKNKEYFSEVVWRAK